MVQNSTAVFGTRTVGNIAYHKSHPPGPATRASLLQKPLLAIYPRGVGAFRQSAHVVKQDDRRGQSASAGICLLHRDLEGRGLLTGCHWRSPQHVDCLRRQSRGLRVQAAGSKAPHRLSPQEKQLSGNPRADLVRQRRGWGLVFRGFTKDKRDVGLLDLDIPAAENRDENQKHGAKVEWLIQALNGSTRSEKWRRDPLESDDDAVKIEDGVDWRSSWFSGLGKKVQAKEGPSETWDRRDSRVWKQEELAAQEEEGGSDDPAASSSWTSLDEPWASILLLNLLAALYGSNAVAAKFVEEALVVPPASLACAVKFSFAALAFSPVLWSVLRSEKSKDKKTVLAGIELGMWLMAGIISQTVGMKSGSNSISLLFTFTIVLVPLLEVSTGRRSISQFTWLASLAALTGMGLLKDHGGLTLDLVMPPVEDLWGLFSSAMFAIQIFRAEMLCQKFDPLRLVACLLGVLAVLSIGWEGWSLLHTGDGIETLKHQLGGLPVWPLMYGGLVAGGLGGLLELTGLQNVHASTATLIYTTIPIWGAFFSFLVRGESIGEPATLVGGSLMFGSSLVAGLLQPKKTLESPPDLDKEKVKEEAQAPVKEEKQQNLVMAAVRELVKGRSGDVAGQQEKQVARKGRRVLGLKPHQEAKALKRQLALSKEKAEKEGVMSKALGMLSAPFSAQEEEVEPEPEPEKETFVEKAIDALTAPFHKEEEPLPAPVEKMKRSNSLGKAAARITEAIITSGENLREAGENALGLENEKPKLDGSDNQGAETDDEEGEAPSVNSDTLPAAYLTTQLKMPFYANQAQGMMAGASGVGVTAGAGASGAGAAAGAGTAAAGGAAATTAAGGAGVAATGAAATGGAAAGTAAAGAGAAVGSGTAATSGAVLTAAAAPATSTALAGAAASTSAAATGAAATGATAAATGAAATGATAAATGATAAVTGAATTGAAATGAAATGAAVTGAAATGAAATGAAATGAAATGAAVTGAAATGSAATGAAALTGAVATGATGAVGAGVAAGAGAAGAGSTAAGALTGAAASAGGALTTAATSAATAATGAAVTGSATTAAAAGAAGAFVGAAAGTAATGATATTVATTGAAAAAAGAIGTAAAVAGGGAITGATGGAAAGAAAAGGAAACGVVPSAATAVAAASGAATNAAAAGGGVAAAGAAGGLLSISVVANEAVNVVVGGIGSPSGAGAVLNVAKAAGKSIVQAASPVAGAGAKVLADLAAETPLAAFVNEVAAGTQAAAGLVTGAGAEAGAAFGTAAQAGTASIEAAVAGTQVMEALAAAQISEAATAVAQSAAVAGSASEVTSAAGMLGAALENVAALDAATGVASDVVVGADPLAQGLTAALQSAGTALEKAVEIAGPVSGEAAGASQPVVNNVAEAVQAVVAAVEKAAETALPVASESAIGSSASMAGDPLASAIASGAADIGAATSDAWISATQAMGHAIEGALPASQGAEAAAAASSGGQVVDPLASEMVSRGAEFAAAVSHAAGPAVQAAVHAATTAAAVAGANQAVNAVQSAASNILASATDEFTWLDTADPGRVSGVGDSGIEEGHRAAATVLGMIGPLDMHALGGLLHVGAPLLVGGLAFCWLLQSRVFRNKSPRIMRR